MVYKVEQLLEREDVKERIIDSLNKTKKANKEHVFNFCMRFGDVGISDIEKGGKGRVIGGISKCQGDAKVKGSFHTHIVLTKDEDIVPSPVDILKSVEENLEFFCIGGNQRNLGIVRCFNKIDLLVEINMILETLNMPITGENVDIAAKHLVRYMLAEKGYLNQHSYMRLYDIKKRGDNKWKKSK